jgi:hypothetical protein
MSNKKRVKAHNPSQSTQTQRQTKPYISLVELGIPNDLNIFRQSVIHTSDGIFDTIAETTLDEARREFFELKNLWNDSSAISEAKKYSSIQELRDNCISAYKYIRHHNLELVAYSDYINEYKEKKVIRWNNEKAIELAKNYKNREQFRNDNSGAWKYILRNNLQDICFPIDKKENIDLKSALNIAKKYGNKLGYKEFPKQYKSENWILNKNGYNYNKSRKGFYVLLHRKSW